MIADNNVLYIQDNNVLYMTKIEDNNVLSCNYTNKRVTI
jgi:hypothetical protein